MSGSAGEECPSEEVVQAFLGGALADGERLALEEHIDRCSACGRVVADLLASLSSTLSKGGDGAPEARAPMVLEGGAGDGQLRPVTFGERVGRFVIIGTAGQGGMGRVFAAQDTALDRKIALKFLSHRAGDQRARDRLIAEASAMARLTHPNVVAVYDVGIHDGQPWIAMELVEGVDLSVWATERRRSTREILTVMAAVARGLGAAHAAGIVHRDVKPQNILVDGARVLVTDFGLSVHDRARPSPGIAGTPGYMAPEQLSGEQVDARTDVFGFCATLYYLLAGVVPFSGRTLGELWSNVQQGRIAPPAAGRRIPGRIERLLRQGLSADPAQRPVGLEAVSRVLLADPARRVRRALLASTVVALGATAFWGGARLSAMPERRCRAGGSSIDAAWSPQAREALRERHGRGVQREAWSILEQRLDRFRKEWLSVHGQTCSATFSEQRQSAQALDLRMSCLESRRLVLASFVSGLESASPAQVVSAAGVPLPSAQECDLSGRTTVKPLPADPAVRVRIGQVQSEIARADAAIALGDLARAARSAEGALAAARQVGYEPLLARALHVAGLVERKRGKSSAGAAPSSSGAPAAPTAPDRAVALQEESVKVAERGGDDTGRAAAARELVHLYTARDRYREAELWAELAGAVVHRMGDPPGEQAALGLAVGWLKWNLSKSEEAAAAFNRSVELYRRLRGPEDPQTALAFAASCEGATDEAAMVACFEKALALTRQAFGPRHPELATLYNNMSGVYTHKPATTSKGCALLVQAKEILDPVVEPAHELRIKVLGNLAYCRQLERRMDEARALYHEALSLVPGPSVERAHLRQGFALLHLDTGVFDVAERYQRLALQERRELLGRTSPRVVTSAMNLADMIQAQGRPPAALAVLEETLADCQKVEKRPSNLLALRSQRAELLRAMGRPAVAIEELELVLAEQIRAKDAPEERGATLGGLGRSQLQLGRRAAAITSLERALTLQPVGQVLPAERATTALALAEALALPSAAPTATELRRACQLAGDARGLLHDDGGIESGLLRQARSFLRQRCRAPGARTGRLTRL